MQVISSKDNEQIKYIKKLKDKKFRDETNEYIVEGIKLVREAIEEAVNIKLLLYVKIANILKVLNNHFYMKLQNIIAYM